MEQGLLSGLKVIEYGEGVSAPLCTRMLADLGAEVIKVEPPITGDSTRSEGPFLENSPSQEASGLFLFLNVNKKSVTLDPRRTTGKRLFRELLRNADLLVTNYPPRELAAKGLSSDALAGVNPRLVFTSITPFGSTGPYRDYKAYPINPMHLSGTASAIGDPDREPLPLPEAQSSFYAAIMAAGASLCALAASDATGRGQQVEVSEADCLAMMVIGPGAIRNESIGTSVPRTGHRMPTMWPNTVLPCKDGYFTLIAAEEWQWQRFVQVMGNPSWASDPLFQNRVSRWNYCDVLENLVVPWLMEHDKEELFKLCQESRVPSAPIYDAREVLNSPQLKERGFLATVEHPVAGPLPYPGEPFILSEAPWRMRRPAPLLGQHNREVYCGRMGLSNVDLVSLHHAGVI